MQEPPMVGLATPYQLQPGPDTLVVQDYILDPTRLDSLTTPVDIRAELSTDNDEIIIRGELHNPISKLKLWVDRDSYFIPLFHSRENAVRLLFSPDSTYKKVAVKGEMNNWTSAQSPMVYKDGRWSLSLLLQPGSYEYLFVADGKELTDPTNKRVVSNGMGGKNSVLTVEGPAKTKLPFIQTVSYSRRRVSIEAQRSETAQVYWQNKFLKAHLKGERLRISIPEEAKNIDRSFIRVWTYNEYGYSNDLLIPLQYGKVVDTADELSRNDWEQTVMYFMMVDRFNNGNPDNDHPVQNPDILPKANYYGGDLKGITQKIKDGYFDSLNVNALWLSPITQNPEGAYGQFPDPKTKFSGYHGYWPISSSKVDYRLGSAQELRKLLDTAHAHGMNVILDYVANHVHELHPVYKQHPGWATDLYLPDSTLNTQNWDSHRLTTWFDTFMPTLDFSRPEVVETMTDSALFWLKEYPLDGFRHDATKHIPLNFWRTLTHKLKTEVTVPQNKRLYQIGETYGSPELIDSYVNSGMLDGQFDFNLYDDAVAVFAKDDEPMTRLSNALEESFTYYGNHNLMGNITGNQDRARFISYAGGDLSFEEDAKKAGWKRDIGVGDSTGYNKLALLHAFNMTIPGIPIIYYGDEIGMPGGNDPDNRRMMRFTDLKPEEKQMRELVSHLAQLRSSRLSLIYGDFHLLSVGDDHLAYARNYFREWTVVLFNNAGSKMQLNVSLPGGFESQKLQTQFGNSFTQKESNVEITLPPYSFEILTTPQLSDISQKNNPKL